MSNSVCKKAISLSGVSKGAFLLTLGRHDIAREVAVATLAPLGSVTHVRDDVAAREIVGDDPSAFVPKQFGSHARRHTNVVFAPREPADDLEVPDQRPLTLRGFGIVAHETHLVGGPSKSSRGKNGHTHRDTPATEPPHGRRSEREQDQCQTNVEQNFILVTRSVSAHGQRPTKTRHGQNAEQPNDQIRPDGFIPPPPQRELRPTRPARKPSQPFPARRKSRTRSWMPLGP